MKAMMTLPELRTWSRDAAIADDDPLALSIMAAASFRVAEAAHHEEWVDDAYAGDPIPFRATLIANLLAARSWNNPASVIAEGGIGPIGGDRFIEDLSRFLELTQAERDELTLLWPAGESTGGGLWVQGVENRPGPGIDDTVWVSESPYPFSDAFPMGSTSDAAAYGL